MSKERLIINEVIVVGAVRPGQEQATLPTDVTPDSKEFKEALRKKFQFVRMTNPNADALTVGFQKGEFIHVLVADPGGATATLPNGKTIKVSRKTNDYGFKVIFKSANGITFDEIKDEIVANRFEVIGTGNEGKIRLTEFGLMGFWDEFALGFAYNPHYRDPKDGVVKPLLSHPRGDDGKYNVKGVPAISRTGRHFILEGEVENLEGLRGALRTNAEKYKITTGDNTDPNRTPVQEVVNPPASTPDISTSV